MNIQAIIVFIIVFCLITILGLVAARWQSGDLNRLQEWGLAGRRFGTITSWFLLGGDLYTAYTLIAVPALVFSSGALGFFAVIYAAVAYPIAYLFVPRLWTVSRHRGYITPADFVRERFGSSLLALAIAITGILATMPYIALQIYGIELVLAQIGIPVEVSLLIAFAILATYTFISGLRAPALIAIAKDFCVGIVILVALIYIPAKLGGLPHIFTLVHQKALANPKTFHDLLPPSQYAAFSTLAFGSALSIFLYPHALTGALSTNSGKVLKRNMFLLHTYSILIGLLCLLGLVAIGAHVKLSSVYGSNSVIPALFTSEFPSWFAGFAMASIAMSALVPAAIMSIGAANLFTRNIYREYIHPACTEREESRMSRLASLVVKLGALLFIIALPNALAINLQLLGGIWIAQTLPTVFLGLYTRRFHRYALLIGWLIGMSVGTALVIANKFNSSVYSFTFGTFTLPIYIAIIALAVNLVVTVVLTPLLQLVGIQDGEDVTTPADYETHPVLPVLQEPIFTEPRVSPSYANTNTPAPSGSPMQTMPTFSPPDRNPLSRPPIRS
jgi:SSS family solute:Na+ symporter